MNRIRIAVVGVGHLGKEHARILSALPEAELVGIADVNNHQARSIADRCKTTAYESHEDLLDIVDAVTIAAPTLYHHKVARDFLERGIPVLVEKPITTTLAQAEELVEIANSREIPFQVGHIERFNPAFEELTRRPINPKLIESERHGPFTGRSTDIGCVLDLMIHDLDLILSLVRSPVEDVYALGAMAFGGHEDIVNARIRFENGCVACVTASRISPRPKRKLRIWASEGYAGIDFVDKRLTLVQPSDEVRRRGLSQMELDPNRREQLRQDVFSKHMETLELDCTREMDQLTAELKHFVNCVKTGRRPRVTGDDGRDALALADRILASVQRHPWDGVLDGPTGPKHMPAPLGKLFEDDSNEGREAA
ncbi:Gfo/Idh/MocA family protein [Zavarzinella formosa]|uniref:Gfo/Idh/MocA family protein n=1 Tax=Zavarzinella formosa TaxID=360055 RepID=UPI0002F7F08A|nr:Gfo/Idh/MocA family oxidoreductase [Zavarzinella formosa]